MSSELCVAMLVVEARRAFMEFSVETGLERRPPAQDESRNGPAAGGPPNM